MYSYLLFKANLGIRFQWDTEAKAAVWILSLGNRDIAVQSAGVELALVALNLWSAKNILD